MQIGIARKYQPVGYMECDQCGGNSHQVRFASSAHKICLSCEQDELKECRACDASKPLTQYPLKIGSVGVRGPICNQCKAAERREKYAIGARCCVCKTKIEGHGTGSKRYCPSCATLPRERKKIIIKSAFNVAAFLAKPWKMSPA